MKLETKSTLVYVVMGVIVGFLSQYARDLYGEVSNYLALGLMLLVLVLTAEVNRKVLKISKDFKWFVSNGGWIYIFVWMISWIIFFNPPFSPL